MEELTINGRRKRVKKSLFSISALSCFPRTCPLRIDSLPFGGRGIIDTANRRFAGLWWAWHYRRSIRWHCGRRGKGVALSGVMASRTTLTVAACASGLVLCYAGKRYLLRANRSDSEIPKHEARSNHSKKPSPAVNKEFFRQLVKLIRISIPGVWTKEFLLLVLHTASLVARTFLSIYVAMLDGRLVRSIVEGNAVRFWHLIAKWMLIAIPATFINSLIRYLESKLALAIRKRLVDYSYKLYFKNQAYYRVSNLDGRLNNPDHSLTEDLQAFSSAVAHIYSHVSKPLLDVLLTSMELTFLSLRRGVGLSLVPPTMGFGIVGITGIILKLLSPKFGKLVAEEARRNGFLRFLHSRIITNAEEIAFYGGHQVRT